MRILGFEVKRAERSAGIEQGNGYSWLNMLGEFFGGVKSSAGISINEQKALSIAAVSTAVRIIGGTVSALPLHVYQRDEKGGRRIALKHWAYSLLHDSPNEYQTTATWLQLMVAHRLLWGDAFSRIEWIGNGSATALYALMPWDVEVKLTSKGVKYYQVRLPDGREDLGDDEVLHIPGLTYDGLRGMSVVGRMRDTMGIAKAAENLIGKFFAGGAKPGWNLQVPGKMSATAQKTLAMSIMERFADKEAMGVMVTEEGSKLVGPLTMPFKDIEFLGIQKFKRSEILAEFGVPPHLAGDTEKSTSWGTGIEQMDIGYAKHTIHPICNSFEQEFNRKLFNRGTGYYSKFNMDALQRGDFKSRMEGLQIAVGRPFLTGNEARELEDWNASAQPDMDKVALPMNTGAGGTPPAGGGDSKAPASENNGLRSLTVSVGGVTMNAGDVHVPERPVTVNHRAGDVNVPERSVTNNIAPVLEATLNAELKPASGRTVTRYARDHNGELVQSVSEHRES